MDVIYEKSSFATNIWQLSLAFFLTKSKIETGSGHPSNRNQVPSS